MNQPLEPNLFHSLEPLRLAGSRCLTCQRVQFPASDACSSCSSADTEVVVLPHEGEVWTWTVQRFAPKLPYDPGPSGFTPFLVGYVDLGEVLVESVLITSEGTIQVGQTLELVRFQVPGSADAWSFAFAA